MVSRCDQIRDRFLADGEAAAYELGAELGLSEATVRTQIGRAARQSGAKLPPPAKKVKVERVALKPSVPSPATPPPMVLRRRVNTVGKPRVYLVGSAHHLTGTLLVAGPEQSEVMWDNGNVNIVVNDWIAPVV